ncbi:MAG: hypothetical protein K0B02_03450 [DPANN group archaeon]|nr:hypothetical protein [DPANN group archaeon]
MSFFNPELIKFRNTGLIVYPKEGIETVMGDNNKTVLSRYDSASIKNLYSIITTESAGPAGRMKLSSLEDKKYFISFLWSDEDKNTNEKKIFFDLWEFNFSWDSGPLSVTYIFDVKNCTLEQAKENIYKKGSGSGNTVIVLGREEEQRRIIEGKITEEIYGISKEELIKLYMKEYFKSENRPELPFNLLNKQNFYIE